MKKIITYLAVIVLFITVSCQKDMDTKPENTMSNVESMEDLDVNPAFQWKTEETYELTVEAFTRGMMEVTGQNGVVYLRVYLKKRTPETFKLTAPTYENSLQLNFKDRVKSISLDNQMIETQI